MNRRFYGNNLSASFDFLLFPQFPDHQLLVIAFEIDEAHNNKKAVDLSYRVSRLHNKRPRNASRQTDVHLSPHYIAGNRIPFDRSVIFE